MELNATIDIIIKDLNEAKEIIDDLKKYPGVPEFQIELAKSKCKGAAEILGLLKSVQFGTSQPVETKVVVQQVIHKEIEPEKTSPPEIHQVNEIKHEIIDEKKNESAPEQPPVMPEINQPPVTKKSREATIIADQFKPASSYNEEIGSHKHDDDVLDKIRTKPLSSLTEAIGINDKFLFVREIFNGNHELYNQAIQGLESAGSLSEARAIIGSFSGEDAENEAVKQLMDLIKRKFPSHE